MNPMHSHVDKIQKSIMNAYKLGITHGNSEKYEDTSAFEKKIQELCKLEQAFIMEPGIIAELPNVEIEQLDGIYKEILMAQMEGDDVKNSVRYQRFVKDIEDIKYSLVEHSASSQAQNANATRVINLGDDDMEMEQNEEEINFVDPITKKLITNPVRNNICKHIYDLESITVAIRNSRKCRCPYIGCSSRAYLTPESLIEDRELKRKIMQHQIDNQ
ncbi:unnamed protein product [Diamesa tonsa]